MFRRPPSRHYWCQWVDQACVITGIKIFRLQEWSQSQKCHVSFFAWRAETRTAIKTFILCIVSYPDTESESEPESIKSPESESGQSQHDSALLVVTQLHNDRGRSRDRCVKRQANGSLTTNQISAQSIQPFPIRKRRHICTCARAGVPHPWPV